MIVEINDTLVNVDNICTVKMHYKITKTPGEPEMKDFPRIFITFLNGKTETITFENAEDMHVGYETMRLFETTINKNTKK